MAAKLRGSAPGADSPNAEEADNIQGATHGSAHVSLKNKLIWGAGGGADNILYNGMSALVLPIFNIGFGVDALKLGLAMGLPRLLDAITDPLIGLLSDNTRSCWGRRRPYIFIGAIVSGLLLALLFNPGSGWSTDSLLVWFLGIASLFYIAYTLFMIPYTALGYELTPDYNERTRVLAWRMYFGLGAGLAIPWLYKLCFVFGETETEGVQIVALFMGFCAIVLGVCPALFLREPPASTTQRKMLSTKAALKATFTNKPFLLLTGSTLCVLLGLFLAAPLGLYVSIFYVFDGQKEAAAVIGGWSGMAAMLSGYIGLPLATYLSTHLGKRTTTLLFLGFACLVSPLSWWFFTPVNPWLQIVPLFFYSLAVNGSFLMGISMLGDVCDADELETGQRREGLYSASLEFGKKLAIALSTVLSGVVLMLIGFDESLSQQSEGTQYLLRISYIVILSGATLVAACLIYFYPLTHQRSLEIRRLLDEHNSAA